MNLKQINRLAFIAFQAIEKDLPNLSERQRQQLITGFTYNVNPAQDTPNQLQPVSRKKIIKYLLLGLNPTETSVLCNCSRAYVYEVMRDEGLKKDTKK